MCQIEIVKNFIDEEECDFFINLINFAELNNNNLFNLWQDGKRIALCFGNVENDIKSEIIAQPNLKVLAEQELHIRKLFDKIADTIKSSCAIEEPLTVCSFWLAKQYPGATVPVHNDTDNGVNPHFDYSVILYLSSVKENGKIYFVDSNFSHSPEKGDLLYFNTRTTGDHLVTGIEEDRYSLVFWLTKNKGHTL